MDWKCGKSSRELTLQAGSPDTNQEKQNTVKATWKEHFKMELESM
jgi:hypothetical protein